MPLLIVEGPRKSGKSYLIAKQDKLPVFKFNFNGNFTHWDFDKHGTDIHWFGLGKEIMLHELDLGGYLPELLIDRGILTNTVWAVFQKRLSIEQAKEDLIKFHKRGLFKNTKILLIDGEFLEERKKDIWDEDDTRRTEEYDLFQLFSSLLRDLGVSVDVFHNNFDSESVTRFNDVISKNTIKIETTII